MSAHEITRAQFLTIMDTDPSDATHSSGPDDPVQMANWYHAITFCNKLSIAEGLTPVYSVTGVTLPPWLNGNIPTTTNMPGMRPSPLGVTQDIGCRLRWNGCGRRWEPQGEEAQCDNHRLQQNLCR